MPFDQQNMATIMGLANWLVDKRNPLTSRVFVTGCGRNFLDEDL
jgi:hypothetical protein